LKKAKKPSITGLKRDWRYTEPVIVNILREQLELTRSGEFPAWDSFQAELAMDAIRMRTAMDPDFIQAHVWATYRERTDPKAARLLQKLDWHMTMACESFYEWLDLSLLAISVTAWSFLAEQLINYWQEREGAGAYAE
jgi:hypothetical protein